MKYKTTLFLTVFILPISVISNSKGTSLKTEVNTTGNGSVSVESSVDSHQSSKTEVTVQDNKTTENEETNGYKKVDVSVDGESVYYSEEGTPSKSATDESQNGIDEKSIPQSIDDVDFQKREVTLAQYVVQEVKRVIEKVMSIFGK